MHLVICYDVVNNNRRQRLAKSLKNFIERVQKSVFEGEVEENHFEKLKEVIAKQIDLETDTVRIYSICKRCQPATEIIGTGIFIDDEQEDFIV